MCSCSENFAKTNNINSCVSKVPTKSKLNDEYIYVYQAHVYTKLAGQQTTSGLSVNKILYPNDKYSYALQIHILTIVNYDRR